jgi:hypothetical protein
MISAASSQLIFFAIAFKITSCNFIIRSTVLVLIDPGSSSTQLGGPFCQSGQITNSFDRKITYYRQPVVPVLTRPLSRDSVRPEFV